MSAPYPVLRYRAARDAGVPKSAARSLRALAAAMTSHRHLELTHTGALRAVPDGAR